GEGVALVEELAVLVPAATHLSAATHVGDGVREPAVEQAEAHGREARVDAVLVGTVPVQEAGTTVGPVLPPGQRDGHSGAVGGRGPPAIRLVEVWVVATEHWLLLDDRSRAGRHVVVDRLVGR